MVAETERKSTWKRRDPEALFAGLPAALKRLREKKKRTQRAAAQRAGVSQSEWALWEAGERALSLDNLARALRGAGATLHELADELEGPVGDGRNAADVLAMVGELHARNKALEQELARSAPKGREGE